MGGRGATLGGGIEGLQSVGIQNAVDLLPYQLHYARVVRHRPLPPLQPQPRQQRGHGAPAFMRVNDSKFLFSTPRPHDHHLDICGHDRLRFKSFCFTAGGGGLQLVLGCKDRRRLRGRGAPAVARRHTAGCLSAAARSPPADPAAGRSPVGVRPAAPAAPQDRRLQLSQGHTLLSGTPQCRQRASVTRASRTCSQALRSLANLVASLCGRCWHGERAS